MKIFFTTLLLLAASASFSQVTVSHGSNQEFKLIHKNPDYSSYATSKSTYFIFRKTENGIVFGSNITVADQTGQLSPVRELAFNNGVINNSYEINAMDVVNDQLLVFVENRNKSEGKNSLSVRVLDEKGDFTGAETPIASLPFVKMTNPGSWFVSVSPDKKHIAVIGKLPHEKDKSDQFQYYFLDNTLKQLNKGIFSYPSVTKNIDIEKLFASDKGEFYLIGSEYDKTYQYPVLYKASISSPEATIQALKIEDPSLKNIGYKAMMTTNNELILAGYTQVKKTFSAGNPAAGTWTFVSSKPEVFTANFEKPQEDMVPVNILSNGNTFYLVGEQYKKEKETPTSQQLLAREENFNYSYGDILVSGFSQDGQKKFNIPVSRKWAARNTFQDIPFASGIINNKLSIIFNDQFIKYGEGGDSYKHYKLPVAVSVTNDGLMEQPQALIKEFNILSNPFKLYSFFFHAGNDRMVILSADYSSVKPVIFK